ncbi:hypothetical protein ScPMuIL_000289 [Solemya velum]
MASYGKGEFGGVSSYQTGYGARGSDDTKTECSRLVKSIGGNIQKITQNVNQIQRFIGLVGTAQDNEELRDRLQQTQHYTNQLAKDTNVDLKNLAHLPMPPSSSEQRELKIQKERLTEMFSDALKDFQTVQRSAAEAQKASVARARAHSSSFSKSPFEDDSQGQFEEFTPGFSQTKQVLQMEEDVDLELLRQREDDIKKLERDIIDVNQIFKDLGMLVHEQGEMLGLIEGNVERAQVEVQEGTQQLSKARDYQSKARRKKCCIIVIVLVVLAIIITIIAVTVPKN